MDPPYLYGPSCVFTITDPQGNTFQKEYRTHGFNGYRQRYDKVLELDHSSFILKGQVLQATAFVLDAPELRRAVLEKLNTDPHFFVEALPDTR